jgi:putative transposase
MLAGISTRRYPVALEPVGQAVEQAATSTSKSAVSRRFVAATAERARRAVRPPAGRAALADRDARRRRPGRASAHRRARRHRRRTKVPLGVVEGSTQNGAVCTRLVTDLVDRGLDASSGGLFVIDGGKALAKAIRATFGGKALIQRCRRHKERNVLDHLPDVERPLVQRRLRAAWALENAAAAERELGSIARRLARKRPGAAASLREGLEQTITVNRLGITGSLLKTVESTNPIESMLEIVRDHSQRVKRWQHGEMALRWTAAGMLAAQAQFRRVKGYRQMPQLLAVLQVATADEPGLLDLPTPVTA